MPLRSRRCLSHRGLVLLVGHHLLVGNGVLSQVVVRVVGQEVVGDACSHRLLLLGKQKPGSRPTKCLRMLTAAFEVPGLHVVLRSQQLRRLHTLVRHKLDL